MKQLLLSMSVTALTLGYASLSSATTYQCSYRKSVNLQYTNQVQASGHFKVGTNLAPVQIALNLLDSLYLKADLSGKNKINFEIFTSDYEGDHETLFVSSTETGAADLSFSYKYNGLFYTVECQKNQNHYQGYGGGCML